MLSVRNLTKTYKTGDGTVAAVDGVSMDFPEKGMVFILGKSGSGKSTLLNLIGGLDRPTDGEIVVDGRSSKDFTAADFDGYRNTYVGFIFQEYNLLGEFDVAHNVALALRLHGKKNTAAEVEKILAKVELAGMGKRKPSTLSGGQKKRVAIARALVKDPAMIIADEPTGALDSETGAGVLALLKSLAADRLVIVVSHDRDFAEKYGDRVIELKDGKIVADNGADKKNVRSGTAPAAKIIKSSLPLGCAVQMGASGLKHHPFRLIVTLLLSVVSFTVFGLFSAMITYDPDYTVASAIEQSRYSSALLAKSYWYDETRTVYEKGKTEQATKRSSSQETAIAADDLAALNAAAADGIDFTGVYLKECSLTENIVGSFAGTIYEASSNLNSPAGFTNCGGEYLEKHFGKPLAGRYPETDGEVAISAYFYRMFEDLGFADVNGGPKALQEAADLCGETIGVGLGEETIYLTVVGIYECGDLSEFDPLWDPSQWATEKGEEAREQLESEYVVAMQHSFHRFLFVTDAFYDKYAAVESAVHTGMELGEWDLGLFDNVYRNSYSSHFMTADIAQKANGEIFSFVSSENYDTLGERECYMSPGLFGRYVSALMDAQKNGEKYFQKNAAAYAAYLKFSAYCEGSRGAEFGAADFETLRAALSADWNDWVKSDRASAFYGCDFDALGCRDGNGNKVGELSVVGICAVNGDYDRKEAFAVVNKALLASASVWSYSGSLVTTKYVPPSGRLYNYALSPSDNGSAQSYFLLGLEDRDNTDDVSYLWVNETRNAAAAIAENIETFSLIFLLSGLGMGLLAALFLLNYISASIGDKRREIGILRAIGARGGDVFKIFFAESFIIAMVCFVLSAVLAGVLSWVIGGLWMTTVFSVSVLNFNALHVLMIFGLTAAVSVGGTVIPVTIAARKAPVECIRVD